MERGTSVTATETIPPHGGTLVDLLLSTDEAERGADEAEHLPKVAIGRRELSDLEMMAVGALSPLGGFMGQKDYRSVLEEMHLSGGLPWSIPYRPYRRGSRHGRRRRGAGVPARPGVRGAVRVHDHGHGPSRSEGAACGGGLPGGGPGPRPQPAQARVVPELPADSRGDQGGLR